MGYDPKFQFEGYEKYTSTWKTLFKQYNEEMKLCNDQEKYNDEGEVPNNNDQESDKERRDHVITKYQEVRILCVRNIAASHLFRTVKRTSSGHILQECKNW